MSRIGRSALLSAGGAAAYGAALIAMDALLASRFGLGDQAAVYQAAYQVPTTLIAILSGGAILGPLIPALVRQAAAGDPADTRRFLARVSGFVLCVHGLVAVPLLLLAPQVVGAIASGFDPALQAETVSVLRWMLPLLLLNGLASVGIAALLALRRAALANLAPALMPVAGMLTYGLWDEQGARWIAWGYLGGMIVQVFLLSAQLRRAEHGFLPPAWPRGDAIREFARTFGATGVAHAALSAVLLVNISIAGSLSEQDLSAFGFGSRLVLLALAFVTALINNVGLPYLSEALHQGRPGDFRPRLRRLLWLATIVGAGISLAWIVAARWIVDLLYARGSFSAADATAVAELQRIFALQAPFYLAGVVCWRALNALGEWRPLLLASAVALIVDVGAALSLSRAFRAEGIAGAHALSMAVWSLALLLAAHARTSRPA